MAASGGGAASGTNQPYTATRIDSLARYLQSLLPGLNYNVATTWITAEKGVNGNVLGVTYNNSTGQHLYTYGSQEAGLQAAVGLLHSNSAYNGFLSSLSSNNAATEAKALAASPWNHSYYTGVFKNLAGGATPTPAATGSGTGSGNTPNPLITALTGNALQGTGLNGTGSVVPGVGIDLTTPAYFIGVVLVAVVLILIGGIIILKPKMPSAMPIPI